MKRCISCLKVASSEDEKCEICKEETLYSIENNQYVYQQQTFSQQEWYERWNTFKEGSTARFMLRHTDRFVHPIYVKKLFLENISKTTRNALLLPGIFFIILGLITSTVIDLSKRGSNWIELPNQVDSIFVFLSLFWFLCGFGLLFKKYILHIRCYRTRSRRQSQIKQLTPMEYKSINNRLDQWIKQNREQKQTTYDSLNTDRLVIREIQMEDAYAYYELLSSKKVCRYLANRPWRSIDQAISSIHQTLQEYKEGQIFRLAITIKETNYMIGYIGLSKIGLTKEGCEVVYVLSEQYWNQGYATEALIGFREVLVNQYQKQWILATHMKENTLSGKVMKKAGFERDFSKDRTMMIHGKEEPLVAYIFWKKN